jgi:hypothetical protein
MNNIPSVFWLIPIASVVALGMAWFFFRSMMKEDEGTDRMKEIAEHVRKGAMAYLKQQYKVVTMVFVVLAIVFSFMAYVLKVQNPWVPFAFLTGGLFSGLAGFFGMKTATYASARTANGARTGLDKGLKIAFRSGAVMGLVVVGLGLLDIAITMLTIDMSLMRMFSEGPEVSLNGSPTVSPTIVALWFSLPLPPKWPSSIIFFALSHAPPELDMNTARVKPAAKPPVSRPSTPATPSTKPTTIGMMMASSDGMSISRCALRVLISTQRP